MKIKLRFITPLGLGNRDGEVSIGITDDEKCYLILGADTLCNDEVFEELGSTEHIEISHGAYTRLLVTCPSN